MITLLVLIVALLLIGGLIAYLLFLGIIFRGLRKVGTWKCQRPESYPSLSVIIPARNEEATIGITLDYLLSQDYPKDRLQIIVVDDRSTDSTAAIVAECARNHSRIELVSLRECPPSMSPKKHALTQGIKHATGDIIVTTDADCSFHPH